MRAARNVLQDCAIVAGKISLVALSIFASIGAACVFGYSVVPLFSQGALGVIGGVTGMGAAVGLIGGTVTSLFGCTGICSSAKRMFRKTDTNLQDCKQYLTVSTALPIFGAVMGAGTGFLAGCTAAAVAGTKIVVHIPHYC
jgi:hypothetical protein